MSELGKEVSSRLFTTTIGVTVGAAVIAASPVLLGMKGGELTTEGADNVSRKFNDLTNDRWDKLREEEKHPVIKLLVDEITAEKVRMEDKVKEGEDKGEHSKIYTTTKLDLIKETYERVMHGMGQINYKTLKAETVLLPMVMAEDKVGAPIDRSNADIKIVLGDLENKIGKIIAQQEFSSEKGSLNGGYRHDVGLNSIDSMACFNPSVIADKLLEFTKLKVEKGISKEAGVDPTDLGNLTPILPRNSCYRSAPDGYRGLLGPGMT